MKNTVVRAGLAYFYAKTTTGTFYTSRVENAYSNKPSVAGRRPPVRRPSRISSSRRRVRPCKPRSQGQTRQVVNTTTGYVATFPRAQSWISSTLSSMEGELGIERSCREHEPPQPICSAAVCACRYLWITTWQRPRPPRVTTSLNPFGVTLQQVTVPFYSSRIDTQTVSSSRVSAL